MLIFVTAVTVVLVVSFLCSIFESVLLSLTRPQIAVISKEKKRAGAMLSKFKQNMDVPIAAIIIAVHAKYPLAVESGHLNSSLLALGLIEYIGNLNAAERLRCEYARFTGASNPGTSLR